MDVITVETKAFKELMAKINVIANYVFSRQDDCKENEDDIWVDSYEVCTFLKISDRTLQRLRSKGEIAYSTIRGRNFYKKRDKNSALSFDKPLKNKKYYVGTNIVFLHM